MKRQLISITLLLIGVMMNAWAQEPMNFKEKGDLVNTLIGTDAHGHTYPGAVAPFGMVQLSPDTRLDGWDGCSGYHYSDSIIYGFSHTHLSGTGCSDYADFLFMPTLKDENNKDYTESFSHDNEIGRAGYYKVSFNSTPITVELTATERAGYHKYTFHNPEKERNLMIDLKHRDFLIDSDWKKIDDNTLVGMRRSKAWNEDQIIFFAARFSEEIQSIVYNQNTKQLLIRFSGSEKNNSTLEAIVSLSSVDHSGALNNLRAERFNSFDMALDYSKEIWEKELKKIDIYGGSIEEQRTFYTSMYHSMITPNLYSDVDGQYRGMDGKIYYANGYDRYTVFSLWDTYRTLHPLMTIIDTKRTKDYIHTALDIYKQNGILPVWELASFETYCMIGFHGISMIADAYMKGIRVNDELTLEAMINNASSHRRIENLKKHGDYSPNLFGLEYFDQYGYISSEMEHESVSKTLEYAYNMWCVAMVAKEQGKDDIYKEFIQKAQYYKNLYNPENKFIQPKENGRFIPDFDPKQIDVNYTEGNGWHYGFYVPQDVEGFIELLGGDKYLVAHLDECFNSTEETTGRNQVDVTGLIGQYAQGNEPSHHMAYLYNYAGEAWKTQELVRKILTTLFTDKPDGICGNDDCGQMSAWYIMSALGFYPVCPGSNEYIIGSPLFSKAIINLENGKQFVVNSPQGENTKYVHSLRLNGKKYNKTYITHNDIMNGGEIKFEMSSQPNKKFGKKKSSRPKSHIKDHRISIVPYFEYDGINTFTDTKEVRIKTIEPKSKIRPILSKETSSHTIPWAKNNAVINIDNTSNIQARARNRKGELSHSIYSNFYKVPAGRKIELISEYDSQYTAGGPSGLIDLIRGSDKWRLGSWQGYHGCDFEAILDLSEKQEIERVGGNFIQETSPWIFMPTKVDYYVSDNGVDFEHLETIENPIDERDETTVTHTFFTSKPINTRYIKVVAKNRGKLPEWHISAGEDAWLFIDEIIIE